MYGPECSDQLPRLSRDAANLRPFPRDAYLCINRCAHPLSSRTSTMPVILSVMMIDDIEVEFRFNEPRCPGQS